MLSVMFDIRSTTGLPAITFAGRAGECPKCAHDSTEEGNGIDYMERLLRKLFRMRPAAAACGADLDGGDDWGVLTCNCKNAFHGA
jgi:hypothetical protein